MPVFNGDNYVAEALDSLLVQTYTDFELVISDNASSDGTQAICRSYAARDRRIRYERQPENMGASWNFNHVFQLARGEYFKWAAHDDLHGPTYLARCVEALDSDPGVLWCHSRSTYVDSVGQLLEVLGLGDISFTASEGNSSPRRRRATRPSRQSKHPYQRLKALMLEAEATLDVYGLIRTEVLKHTALMLPFYGSEKVLVAELCLRGRYHEIEERLFFVRMHPEGSGYLATAAEQQQYENPKDTRRFKFQRLPLLLGYMQAALRAPLGPSQRIYCFLVIGRYLFQVRKWGRVLVRTLAGRGTGGAYLRWLKDLKQRDEGKLEEVENNVVTGSPR